MDSFSFLSFFYYFQDTLDIKYVLVHNTEETWDFLGFTADIPAVSVIFLGWIPVVSTNVSVCFPIILCPCGPVILLGLDSRVVHVSAVSVNPHKS